MTRLLAIDYRGLGPGTSDTVDPTAPTSPVVTSITPTTATVAWSASTDNVGVTAYHLYDNTLNLRTFIASTIPSVRTYNLTGLATGQDNEIWITALDAVGNESTALRVIITTTVPPDVTAPSVPTNLVAGISTTTTLSFSCDSSSDSESGVDHYIGLVNTVATVTSDTPDFLITGLTPGTSYSLTVKAVDVAGNVSAASSAISQATAPGFSTASIRAVASGFKTAGGNVTATIPAGTQAGDLMLAWVCSANGETLATPSGWTTRTSPITNVTIEASFFTRTAAGSSGTSTDASTTLSVTMGASQKSVLIVVVLQDIDPTTPLNVFSSASDTVNQAAHTFPSLTTTVASCYYLGVIVNRDTSGLLTTAYTLPTGWTSPTGLITTGGTSSESIYTGTPPAVVASGAHTGNVVTSNVASSHVILWAVGVAPGGTPTDTTNPSQVTGLKAPSILTNSISLGWTAATDNSGTIASYRIYWNAGVGTVANTFYKHVNGTVLSANVPGLTPDTAYAFAVSAVDPSGNEGAVSGTIRPKTLPINTGGASIYYGIQCTGSASAQTRLGDRSIANGWVGSDGVTGLIDSAGNGINVGFTRMYYPPGAFPTAFNASNTTGGFGTNVNKRVQICWKGNSGFQNFQDVANGGADIAYCRFVNSIPAGWEVAMTFHHEPNGDFNTTNNTPVQYNNSFKRLGALLEGRAMPPGLPAKDSGAAAISLNANVLVYNEICFTIPPSATTDHWPDVQNAIPHASNMDANAKLCLDAYQNPPPAIGAAIPAGGINALYPTPQSIWNFFFANILTVYGYGAAGHGYTIGEWMAPLRTNDNANHDGQTNAGLTYLNYLEAHNPPPYCIRVWEDKLSQSDAGAQFDQTAYAGFKRVFVDHATGVNAR